MVFSDRERSDELFDKVLVLEFWCADGVFSRLETDGDLECGFSEEFDLWA